MSYCRFGSAGDCCGRECNCSPATGGLLPAGVASYLESHPVGFVLPTHDPFCTRSEVPYDPWRPCYCDVIAKVRAEERWATVESAVFVASQYGCDDGLLNALNAMHGDS